MNYLQILSLFLGMALLSTACHSPRTPKDLSRENLIPLPVSVAATGSSFLLESGSRIYVASEDLLPLGEHLAAYLRPATGFNLPVNASQANPTTGDIYFSLAEDAELGAEGYQLEITEGLVHISANEPAGLFYGIQTLRQLLPPAIEKNTVQKGPWEIATGTIRDYPEYAYRGSMLDVARHFFAVEEVKQYIDHLVTYKMNYLHLHLSDDQGWRIEIKSWPKLTEVGGSTEVGGGEGGFYTQEQYAELVTYAAERYVTLVPEIDMPGHTMAALASYPELYCPGKGKEPALYTGIEVGFSTLCVDKELTYQFVDDVVREIAAITPGPYFHLGGDESLSTPLKDYIPFINRVQQIVVKHGKQVMGWDEIAEATLVPDAVAHFWKFPENALGAVEQGAKLLMSPAARSYMDMQYDSTTQLGQHWAAYIEVDEAYDWDPVGYEEGIEREHILGFETPIWTETMENMEDIEYMMFPRFPGYAEIAWTAGEKRDWEEYKVRLGKQKARFEAMGIKYYASERVPWE